MCDPITAAGAAMSAGSMAANSMASSKVAKARQQAQMAERARQSQLQGEASAINDKSRKSYDGFGGQQEAKASDLASMFKQSAPSAGGNVASPSTSGIVNQEQAKKSGEARAYGDQQSTALGNLRSFGDVMGGLGRGQARDAGYVGQIGNFMQGSAGVLPYELEAANSKGNNLKLFGDILGAGGGILTSAGLGGGGGGMFSNIFGGGAGAGQAVQRTGLGFGLNV